jgi:1,4-alpha-glucan branching enzyme
MRETVRFTYYTGIRGGNLFSNALLVGSWDAQGRYSDQWSERKMEPVADPCSPDGCLAFATTVDIDADTPSQVFYWGVRLDGPAGKGMWGIQTEEKDPATSMRRRAFTLGDENALFQAYYLNHSRHVGAQKYGAGIRFCVWAPNAARVELCLANLWPQGKDPRKDSLINPRSTPAITSHNRHEICGGYVTDGAGLCENWGPFELKKIGGGFWATDPTAEAFASFDKFDHVPYMFRVTKDNGDVAYRTDLYSRCQIGYGADRPAGPYTGLTEQLDGSVSCSVVVNPDRVTADFSQLEWPETKWTPQDEFFALKPAHPQVTDLRFGDLVIYELHLGALGFGHDSPGTLEDAMEFLDYIQDLGVNTVELLPLSEFGGGGSGWGYATSQYFAIEYSGGGRDQYKWFIRECHSRGIAVILDVVYNHYNHQAERAEWLYDTASHDKNAYYWYEGRVDSYPDFDRAVGPNQAGQGGYVDNVSTAWAPRYWEEPVRNMFVSSAITLAHDFHVDGFRADQTTSIREYNVLHADNRRPVPNANAFGAKLLRELTRSLRFVCPKVKLIAEDHGNWDGTTRPPDEGGLGFDGTWYADFYHHLIGDTDKGSDYAKLIKTAGLGDDRPLAMDYFAGALQATSGGKKVVYNESHDEAGNGKLTDRTINVAVNGAPLCGETRKYAEARCRFAAGVTLLSAGVPMFLFGEEVGAEKKFLYGQVLNNREDFAAMRRGSGAALFEYYRQLIRLRLAHPGFRSPNIDVLFVHNEHRLIVFHRWGAGEDFLVFASLDNRPFNNPSYRFRADRIPGGAWREIFNSDAAAYGGNNVGNYGRTIGNSPGFFECVVPANGIVVFQRQA